MNAIFDHPRAWVLVLVLSVAAGCGGGGSGPIKGHKCGMGAPCSAGAKCEIHYIESGFSCDCDASGHFFCESHAGGGAAPWTSCTAQSACNGNGGAGGAGAGGGSSCSETNGYCTRTCQCMGTCSDKCDGMGPPQGEPGQVCDEAYCSTNKYGACSVSDGTCNYEVNCHVEPAEVSGSCP